MRGFNLILHKSFTALWRWLWSDDALSTTLASRPPLTHWFYLLPL